MCASCDSQSHAFKVGEINIFENLLQCYANGLVRYVPMYFKPLENSLRGDKLAGTPLTKIPVFSNRSYLNASQSLWSSPQRADVTASEMGIAWGSNPQPCDQDDCEWSPVAMISVGKRETVTDERPVVSIQLRTACAALTMRKKLK